MQMGFGFDRQAAGSHEIWHNPTSNRYTTIPNHPGDMPDDTLRAILKQADIEAVNGYPNAGGSQDPRFLVLCEPGPEWHLLKLFRMPIFYHFRSCQRP